MTGGQRRVLVVAAALAAVVLVAVLLTSSGGESRRAAFDRAVANRSGTTVTTATPPTGPLATATTVVLQPVPAGTAPPRPARRGSGPTTSTSPTTSPATPPPVIGADGAFLIPPQSPSTRTGDPQNCTTLADPGGWSATCGYIYQATSGLVWLVESRSVGGVTGWRAYTFRQVAPGQWATILGASDDAGQYCSSVRGVSADVVGDGGREGVIGFHGKNGDLVLEVVMAPGRVAMHHVYPLGSAVLSSGGIDTWDSVDGGASFEHDVLRYLSGAWRVVGSTTVTPPPPPSSV